MQLEQTNEWTERSSTNTEISVDASKAWPIAFEAVLVGLHTDTASEL